MDGSRRAGLPLRLRLTLLSGVALALTLTLGGFLLFARFRAGLLESLDAALRSRAQTLLAGIGESGDAFSEGGGLIDPDESFAQVLSPGGTIVESSAGLGGGPLLGLAEMRALERTRLLERDVVADGEPTRARLLAVRSTEGPIIVVGASLEPNREALARLGVLLALGIPGAVFATTGLAWLLTGAALRPIERMRAEAAAITASDLDHRLPVASSGDEVARLGETLNEMLDRLDEAIRRERRFVDDASHELRTPVGIIKAELELALRGSKARQELEAAIRSAAEEADRLERLAEDLLVLGRADRGRLPVRREPVDVAALADEVIAGFERRATDARIALPRTGTGSAPAEADPLRIRQALVNLLDNALTHTPAGGTVAVDVQRGGGRAVVRVTDSGPGFPPGFLPRALEPFARSDAGRSRADGGTGLGLAIVHAIARAHGGKVEAANAPGGGAEVTLEIGT